MEDGDTFSATVFGWKVTTPPPPITGTDQFGQNPGPSFALQSADFSPVADQSVTPATPTSPNLIVLGSPTVLESAWFFPDTEPLQCELLTPYNCSITLTLTISGIAPAGSPACVVYMNGQVAGSMPCGSTLGPQTLVIPFGLLKPINLSEGAATNTNLIQIGGTGSQASFVVASIAVQSTPVPIVARARWIQLAAGDIPANPTQVNSATYTIDVTSGTSSTRSQTNEYATSLNISGTAGVGPGGDLDPLLDLISLSLSAGFTQEHSHTDEHSITIDKSTSVSWSYTVYGTTTNVTTYQIWQLEISYLAGTPASIISQQLSMSVTPIIIRTYLPGTAEASIQAAT